MRNGGIIILYTSHDLTVRQEYYFLNSEMISNFQKSCKCGTKKELFLPEPLRVSCQSHASSSQIL